MRHNGHRIIQLSIRAQTARSAAPDLLDWMFSRVSLWPVQTVLFYAHYDGQPVNPKEWSPGVEPFAPRFITAPMANYDDNQHAENENLKIQYLREGIETYAAIMTMDW